jgi:hypothetical protein
MIPPSFSARRRAWAAVGLAATVAGLVVATPLLANGGTVRISRAAVGPYLVSVFSSPTPLRTGEVDISVLVQDAERESILDVPIEVTATPIRVEGGAAPIRHTATREEATNKLFKAAKFDVLHVGEWAFEVTVGGEEGGSVAFLAELTSPTLADRPFLLATLVLLPLGILAWLLLGREEDPAGRRRDQSRIAATT